MRSNASLSSLLSFTDVKHDPNLFPELLKLNQTKKSTSV
jgi:hypothetical protein